MTTPTPPRFRLTAEERAAIAGHWTNLRIASRKAGDAAQLWRQRNAELLDLAKRSGWDDIRTADTKNVNLGMKDAASTHAFWTTETQRISALLSGELAARELLGVNLATATADAAKRPTLVRPAADPAPTMAKVG